MKLNCSFELHDGVLRLIVRAAVQFILGIPFDRPVIGYGGKTINTLRLWAAAAGLLRLPAIQSRGFRGGIGGDARSRVAHACALSR